MAEMRTASRGASSSSQRPVGHAFEQQRDRGGRREHGADQGQQQINRRCDPGLGGRAGRKASEARTTANVPIMKTSEWAKLMRLQHAVDQRVAEGDQRVDRSPGSRPSIVDGQKLLVKD